MWGYGQCLDNIEAIVRELNGMFSMLIELLTNDSLLQSATSSVPDLVSAIKATSLTLCVMQLVEKAIFHEEMKDGF